MTADLSVLIARLEAAETGSDELSAHVMQALVVPNGRVEQSRFNGVWCIYIGDRLWQERGWWRPDGWPVSTSLDAALALAERVLPGWQIGMWTTKQNAVGSVLREDGGAFDATSSTPALALCIAVLRAKQGEGG